MPDSKRSRPLVPEKDPDPEQGYMRTGADALIHLLRGYLDLV